MIIAEYAQNVENDIRQYENACREENMVYDMMRDLENQMSKFNTQLQSQDANYSQQANLERLREANITYQRRLQQAQNEKSQALVNLQSTRSEMLNVIESLRERLPKFEKSIGSFEQMSKNSFGASAAAQLPKLYKIKAEIQQNLNDANSLIDRIDSVIEENGTSPRHVLKKR